MTYLVAVVNNDPRHYHAWAYPWKRERAVEAVVDNHFYTPAFPYGIPDGMGAFPPETVWYKLIYRKRTDKSVETLKLKHVPEWAKNLMPGF